MAGNHRRLSAVFISIKSIIAFRTADILINKGEQCTYIRARPGSPGKIEKYCITYARVTQHKHKIN